jgi:hypothetical protein
VANTVRYGDRKAEIFRALVEQAKRGKTRSRQR